MAVEAKRGCGFRVVGGTYLVAGPGGFDCGRLPIPLLPCALCDHVPGFIRGMRKVVPKNFLHAAPVCARTTTQACDVCPFERAFERAQGAMMWVGDKFYTSESFTEEASTLGPSKRIGKVPHWFKLGMWVYMAHEKVIDKPCPTCVEVAAAYGCTGKTPPILVMENCEECGGSGMVKTPAIFFAFRPSRIERIIPKTMSEEDRAKLIEEGLTPVEVPDHDSDHQPRKGREED
jgi:hypothetical protein